MSNPHHGAEVKGYYIKEKERGIIGRGDGGRGGQRGYRGGVKTGDSSNRRGGGSEPGDSAVVGGGGRIGGRGTCRRYPEVTGRHRFIDSVNRSKQDNSC